MEVWGIWTPSQATRPRSKWAKDGGKLNGREGMPGAGLTLPPLRQAPSEMLALKPYWGKPTVRDFRGDDGNVGIIRSPVRATVLPDLLLCPSIIAFMVLRHLLFSTVWLVFSIKAP